MHVIRAPRVVADSVPLGPACVAVSDGVIVGVVAVMTYGGVRPDVVLPSGVWSPAWSTSRSTAASGSTSSPPTRPAGPRCPRRLPETGVTSFVLTFITAPVPDLVAALRRTAALPADLGGARVLGVHVEGPFLAPTGTARTTRRCCATPPRRRSTR